MKVLVADKLEKSAIDGLGALGCEVVMNPDLAGDALAAAIGAENPAVVVVRSTVVDRAAIEASSSLKVIIRAGAGYNTIDVAAAGEQGVAVANCPGKNAIAVAELAFGLMLALDRFIPENVNDLRDGKWNKKGFGKGRGLFGMTLGVIGMGSIGQEVAVRARAFGMPVVTYSVNLSDSEALELGVTKVSDLKELASRSDIVSLHTSLNASTKGLITAEFFDAMKPGAFFINTSRAEVVDQAALLAACESGKIRAGLDVFEGEPSTAEGAYSGAMCDARGVYCTHHIGASTEQAQEAVAAEVVRIVDVFGRSGEVLNRVN